MHSGLDGRQTLSALEGILESSQRASALSSATGGDASDGLLGRVLFDRIQQTTALVGTTLDAPVDAADIVAMRLLLVDYVAAAAYLRGAAMRCEARLTSAAEVLKSDGRRLARAATEATRGDLADAPSA